jgi:regulator of replication initiation timing
MTGKRFTLTYEKIGKHFTMGIVDHETKEPFDDTTYEFNQCSFNDSKDEMEVLCLLLNELHEENEQLKHKLQQQEMEYATDLHRLAEENEQLRTKNNAYIQDIEVFKEENTHLKLENEQLKDIIDQLRTDNTKQKKQLNETMKQNKHTTTTIKTMMENERTELGRSVLRQLWSAIQ